jgi:hypothetical protein
MTVNYRNSAGVDLDLLFKPRTGAAAANTEFLDSAGVDLSQRYEPRGTTTARPNVNYRNTAAVDLSQVFMDINTAPIQINQTLGAVNSGTLTGYRNSASGYGAIGSLTGTAEWTIGGVTYRLEQCTSSTTLSGDILIRVSNATVTPPNTDACFTFIRLTGDFVGANDTPKVFLRSANYVTNTGTTPNGRPMRLWQINVAGSEMVNGNNYGFELG